MSGSAGQAGSPSCPRNTTPPADRCRNAADCGVAAFCSPTKMSGGCGFMMQAPRACDTDPDCGSGNICQTRPLQACETGTPTVCVAGCTSNSCADGEVCGTDGHCGSRSCEDGYECPSGLLCAADRMYADAHGCAPKSCVSDGYACPDDRTCMDASSTGTSDMHGCVPKQCSGGTWTCQDGFECSDTATDAHGCRCVDDGVCGPDAACGPAGNCVAKGCASDDDCDCGVCINAPQGQCMRDFWYCSYLVP